MQGGCIVVATDFSARADRAIDRARQLTEALGARLCVVHAIDPADKQGLDKATLDHKMRACVGADEGGTVEFLFPEGSPPRAIASCCDDDDVKLLVIAPARYNSIGDYFLGTAVDYVLRHTEKPVLVAKNRARGPYHTLVAGTDFSPASAYAIIAAARMFPDAAVHVVHAWRVPFESWQRDRYVADETEKGEAEHMQHFLRDLAAREPRLADATSAMVRGSAAQAIRQGLELDPAALVVLGSHGASGFRQAAIGSVTSDLLGCIDADVLVVNTRGAQA